MNLALYKLIPRALLTKAFYHLSRMNTPPVKNAMIWGYQKITGANTHFAAEKNPYHYKNLNDFFTRALADGERPIDGAADSLISPVDGRCAIWGKIEAGQLYQAKTRQYSLAALLNSNQRAQAFEGGTTATLYLAPDDYHRIHMPCDGRLIAMSFCPGDRHSVALDLLEHIPNLFAANERLVCHFETEFGQMALVMVGALNVSSIETVWHGEVNDSGDNHYRYSPAKTFKKGDEIGRFNLGSTVILCFSANMVELMNPKLSNGNKIYMGEALGKLQA